VSGEAEQLMRRLYVAVARLEAVLKSLEKTLGRVEADVKAVKEKQK
jgi:hypothetical protein